MGQIQGVPVFPKLLDEEGATLPVWSGQLRVSGEGWETWKERLKYFGATMEEGGSGPSILGFLFH